MSARAGVVVTGTEVLTGRVQDRNGPWLADQLLNLGVELAHTTICGDRPEDMAAALGFQADQGCDVIVTSGGLGPTADDMTMAVVAEFCGRAMVHDAALEERIQAIVRPLLARYPRIDEEALRKGSEKQATVPEAVDVLEPAGTAPGAVVTPVDKERPAIVVLPGPPRELQAMWPPAVETEAFKRATAGAVEYEQRTLRLFGMPESEIAETLRVAEPRLQGFDGLEITTCLRRGEVEVVVRSLPEERERADALEAIIAERHPALLFSRDGTTIDEQVARLLTGRWTALAESCTGGLLAARLTERPGSSAYVAGGIVSYSNESKSELLGVDPGLIERHGAVSLEVAEAMADGALARFGADTAAAITGIAGPDGGTEEKPVGYVCWCVKTSDGRSFVRDTRLPGGRADVRDRSTTVAMHLLRRLLRGEPAI
ncbi:MAG TPA: competence/damage-inducible protein A [Thermoleophilaceae bacterium]|nr:competence/damage-inducible protein A [Thermoleophilaceae bacterium]